MKVKDIKHGYVHKVYLHDTLKRLFIAGMDINEIIEQSSFRGRIKVCECTDCCCGNKVEIFMHNGIRVNQQELRATMSYVDGPYLERRKKLGISC